MSQGIKTLISLWKGDITKLKTNAIVNAANYHLAGGGGVDGAIHLAAGPSLLKECEKISPCPAGEAKITRGYSLPADHVIHTVGPMDTNPTTLKRCYDNCLRLAVNHQIKTIAFPCISTGIYGYPNEEAAKIAMDSIKIFIDSNPGCLDEVIFCVFLKKDYEIYQNLLSNYFENEQINIYENRHSRQV